eukprot:6189836-Pleurochrysis_carterae.AAC.2
MKGQAGSRKGPAGTCNEFPARCDMRRSRRPLHDFLPSSTLPLLAVVQACAERQDLHRAVYGMELRTVRAEQARRPARLSRLSAVSFRLAGWGGALASCCSDLISCGAFLLRRILAHRECVL